MEKDGLSLCDRLYGAVRSRNVPCSRDDLAAALRDPVEAKWAVEQLQHDRLLTKEERDL
jgi:hypothetical protein